MAKIRTEPRHRASIEALLPRVEAAFTGPALWRPFVRDAHAAEVPRLSNWLEAPAGLSTISFAAAGCAACGPPIRRSRPRLMDGLIAPIRDAIHPRRYWLTNRERTNRLRC